MTICLKRPALLLLLSVSFGLEEPAFAGLKPTDLKACIQDMEAINSPGLSDDHTYQIVRAEAIRLSALWHKGQVREKGNPFSHHYQHTESILVEFGFGPEKGERMRRMEIVTRLHDVVEKTEQTTESIQGHFGKRIAEMVDNVTPVEPSDPNDASQRLEAKRLTFLKARRETDTVIIKLADRISNMRSFHSSGISPKHYLDDYALMKSILYKPGEADAMWKELDYLVENSARLAAARTPL